MNPQERQKVLWMENTFHSVSEGVSLIVASLPETEAVDFRVINLGGKKPVKEEDAYRTLREEKPDVLVIFYDQLNPPFENWALEAVNKGHRVCLVTARVDQPAEKRARAIGVEVVYDQNFHNQTQIADVIHNRPTRKKGE